MKSRNIYPKRRLEKLIKLVKRIRSNKIKIPKYTPQEWRIRQFIKKHQN